MGPTSCDRCDCLETCTRCQMVPSKQFLPRHYRYRLTRSPTCHWFLDWYGPLSATGPIVLKYIEVSGLGPYMMLVQFLLLLARRRSRIYCQELTLNELATSYFVFEYIWSWMYRFDGTYWLFEYQSGEKSSGILHKSISKSSSLGVPSRKTKKYFVSNNIMSVVSKSNKWEICIQK